MLNRYAKAIVALLMAFTTALAAGYADELLTRTEIVVAVSAALVSLGAVWAAPEGKALVGALVATLGAVATGYADDVLTTQDWIAAAVALLGGLSLIWATPNTEPPPST